MAKASTKKSAPKKIPQKDVPAPKSTGQAVGTLYDSSLQDLFLSELKDTYWAENHLVKSIPKMIDGAGAKDLKKALQQHLNITVTHASRLERVFELLGEKILAKKCDAMEGLTMSGEHVIENTAAGTATRDLGIMMSALKVENFEITTYKGLIQSAITMGKTDVSELLQQTLEEETEASDLLTDMSASASAQFNS